MPRAFLLLIVLVSTIPPMLADVFTVGPGGTHASIQDAVDAAIALGGDNEIRLQQATYNASVLISDALTSGSLLLDGGWTAGFSQRAADRSLTILSGEMMRRVLEIDSPAGAVTIQNLTIQDGFHVNRGAGINIECSTCTARFAALRLSGNRADATGSKSDERALGAAIYGVLAGTGRLEIDDCDIENNLTRGVSTGLGAVGLELKGSAQAVLQGSRWIGNQNHGDSTRGAGLDVVAADSSSLDIFACKFNANSNVSAGSTTVGGGLNLNLEDNSVFSIRESEFRGNRHTNPESQSTGTGLFVGINDRAEGEFVDNQILENESAGEGGDVGSGGAIWLKGEATVVIERTEWMSNTSDSSPPQLSLIVQGSSSMVFRDSLVADGSSVGIGSFVDDPESEMRLVNITAADHANRALLISGPGTKSVYNPVFFNNGDEPLFGKGTDLGNNLIGVDPFFIDPGGGDYRLSPGSPAVDGGNDVPPGGLGNLDLDRDARVEGPAVDIGAYELASQDGVTQYLTQIGNGRAGNIVLQTEIDLARVSGVPTGFSVESFDSDGNPWMLDLPNGAAGSEPSGGPVSSLSGSLEAGQTLSIQTSGQGVVEAGYSRIRSAGSLGVTGIFTRTDAPSGTVLYQAGVPAAPGDGLRRATLFVDSLGDLETGLAIVNVAQVNGPQGGDNPGEFKIRLFDQAFSLVDEAILLLGPGKHEALFASQLFPMSAQAQEMQGVLTVESPQLERFALVTLRQNDAPNLDFPDEVPTLAAFPVLPNAVEPMAAPDPQGFDPIAYYFAQIGNGRAGAIGFQTSLSFANTTPGTKTATVDFFQSSGEPAVLTLPGFGTDSSFDLELKAGESIVLKTDGVGVLTAGYARVSTLEGLDGSAVFSRVDLPSGILETESGVPGSLGQSAFSLFVDTTGDSDTGVALVNTAVAAAGPPAGIELSLFDMQGQLLATEDLELPPGQHTARFVTEIFSEVEGVNEIRGLLAVSCPGGSIAAVTLRQNDDPAVALPQDVGTLTAFPVLVGTP